MERTELQRYLGIAIGGAVAAVAADFVYSRYGNEIRELIRQVLHLAVENGNVPQAPEVNNV